MVRVYYTYKKNNEVILDNKLTMASNAQDALESFAKHAPEYVLKNLSEMKICEVQAWYYSPIGKAKEIVIQGCEKLIEDFIASHK